MEGKDETRKSVIAGVEIPNVIRSNCIIDSGTERLGIGQRGKLGGPGDGRAGISDFGGSSASEILEEAKRLFKIDYERKNGEEFKEGRTYPLFT